MQQVFEAGLYSKAEKCEFHKGTVRYFRMIISTQGISVDEDRIEPVWN
jgi:hypothetical protein